MVSLNVARAYLFQAEPGGSWCRPSSSVMPPSYLHSHQCPNFRAKGQSGQPDPRGSMEQPPRGSNFSG